MWQYTLSTNTAVPAERLWEVLVDVPNWAAWDGDTESARPSGPAGPGAAVAGRPPTGRRLRFRIEEFAPPRRLTEVAHLLGADVRLDYQFEPTRAGTRVRVSVRVDGPLSFLWRRRLAERMAERLPDRTERFVRRAAGLAG